MATGRQLGYHHSVISRLGQHLLSKMRIRSRLPYVMSAREGHTTCSVWLSDNALPHAPVSKRTGTLQIIVIADFEKSTQIISLRVKVAGPVLLVCHCRDKAWYLARPIWLELYMDEHPMCHGSGCKEVITPGKFAPFGGGSVVMFGCLFDERRQDIVTVDGNLTGGLYRPPILDLIGVHNSDKRPLATRPLHMGNNPR